MMQLHFRGQGKVEWREVKDARRRCTSIALKSLESEFNQPFFDRSGGGQQLRPTESGLLFYQHAVEILRRCDSVSSDFQVKKARAPRIRVGVLSTIAAADIMAAVSVVGKLGI